MGCGAHGILTLESPLPYRLFQDHCSNPADLLVLHYISFTKNGCEELAYGN
jgi:hypothetical protein